MENKTFRYFTGKRILITGGSGYLATNLARALSDCECTVVRLSRKSHLPPVAGRVKVVDMAGEITKRATWETALDGVDIVYHLAAQTSVYVAEKDAGADFQANVLPMLTMLETCRRQSWRPAVVFSGTVTEAGIPQQLPVDEDHRDHPVTIYDLHKLMAENYLKYYSAREIVSGTTLRLANVYGPGPKSSSSDRAVINLIMRRALAGEALTIYGKGEWIRDYIYVDDVITAFLRAAKHIEQVKDRHFVIGSGERHTIAQAINLVAERVGQKTGKSVPVTHVDPPDHLSPIEARNFVADTRQFRSATGWHVVYSMREGVDLTLRAYLDNGGQKDESPYENKVR